MDEKMRTSQANCYQPEERKIKTKDLDIRNSTTPITLNGQFELRPIFRRLDNELTLAVVIQFRNCIGYYERGVIQYLAPLLVIFLETTLQVDSVELQLSRFSFDDFGRLKFFAQSGRRSLEVSKLLLQSEEIFECSLSLQGPQISASFYVEFPQPSFISGDLTIDCFDFLLEVGTTVRDNRLVKLPHIIEPAEG